MASGSDQIRREGLLAIDVATGAGGRLNHGDAERDPAGSDGNDVEFLRLKHTPVVGVEPIHPEAFPCFLPALRIVVGDGCHLGILCSLERRIESVSVVALPG